MLLSDKMQKELMDTFEKELEEHLGILNKGLLALEQSPEAQDREVLLAEIFRSAHSLKGAARFVKLKDIELIAHRLEDALSFIRKEGRPPTSEQIDAFLQSLDAMDASMKASRQGEKLNEKHLGEIISRLSRITGKEEEQAQKTEKAEKAGALLSSATSSSVTTQNSFEISAEQTGHAQLAPYSHSGGEDTIRVTTAKLDALMGNMGELMIVRMRTEQFIDQIKAMQQHVLAWQKSWLKARPGYVRLKRNLAGSHDSDFTRFLDFVEHHEQELKAVNAEINALLGNLKNDRNYLHLVTDDMHNSIRNARMLPIATLFDIFPRMVRDLARDFGKDIILEMTGQETEVDRQALEMIKDPLMHIVRNAVDHGIEPPEERVSIGKPRSGTIRISAEHRGSNLLLIIADDGRGVNPASVRRAAVERGLLSAEEVETLGDQEVVELIFCSGISTAEKITDISGRGVGMDVVRTILEQMHGQAQVETAPGLGTMLMLTFPLTIATSQALLVRVAGETLALPMSNVERMLRVSVAGIKNVNGHPAIFAEGRPLSLFSLSQILEFSKTEQPFAANAKIPVLITSLAEKRIALRVDAFLSTQQIVVKSLGSQLRKIRKITGVAILGDGQLVPVLNMADIMKAVHTKALAPALLPLIARETRRRHVLVVDDSITTRTLEKHILENAGYEVATSVDGQEAWDRIRSSDQQLPDVVVSDVDMPRINGFGLAGNIKADSRYAHIPVVLVTSLDDPADRLRGLEAGADAYIVKTTFDQRELLEAIERLIR
ncbi:MAG TPA: hybrid sensor histidine kinase/response regulator [Smithellaceae bacterium]|nr:hybrid sensor histidine kinase/response regulator [Smithellaceae bacterium]HQM44887.1 hybrid sensor histidine kinase/response regulator [Smithellaceae bacterium]